MPTLEEIEQVSREQICKLKNGASVSVIDSKRGSLLVIHFTNPRVFKMWLSQNEATKEKFANFFRKSLGIPVAFLPPEMKLQVIQVGRVTWKKIWHVLSGQKRTDRLIKQALENFYE